MMRKMIMMKMMMRKKKNRARAWAIPIVAKRIKAVVGMKRIWRMRVWPRVLSQKQERLKYGLRP